MKEEYVWALGIVGDPIWKIFDSHEDAANKASAGPPELHKLFFLRKLKKEDLSCVQEFIIDNGCLQETYNADTLNHFCHLRFKDCVPKIEHEITNDERAAGEVIHESHGGTEYKIYSSSFKWMKKYVLDIAELKIKKLETINELLEKL